MVISFISKKEDNIELSFSFIQKNYSRSQSKFKFLALFIGSISFGMEISRYD